MLDTVWMLLKDPSNREVLAWLGSGIVVVGGGLWTVFRFFVKKGDGVEAKPIVRAANQSVAAGRDIKQTSINIDAHRPPKS